ncbi:MULTISPECIES: DUF423 domain-containing protein [unclassified Psychrobacter]|uniref:DUF423 domain-containing protein n=1 Tax=unclassified Psychrobacter TaxID=196806 RepID=UPI000EE48536|nr:MULTISPECIES: DUF423 domain-containing protein [unclassified Psychrobacter]MBE8608225.1 DUF423 domain-containing protein [Pseudomonas lundensis]HCI75884.1 DUF423 domain-containing protein [Psychrobacter sp.]
MLNWIGIAAINMAIAVALGAFGAHGLKNIASAQQLEWWHTATLYLFIHALGLLLVGLLIRLRYATQTTAWLLQIGVIIFAGSLYAMTLGAPLWFGAITPIGGVLMIAGWLWLAVSSFKMNKLVAK